MQAYEFIARPENGVIPIPEEYKGSITSNVKVIVLEMKPEPSARTKAGTRQKSNMLLAPTLDTSGWKFNREDANAR